MNWKVNWWFAAKAGIVVAVVGSLFKLLDISAVLNPVIGLPAPTAFVIQSVIPLLIYGFIAGIILGWWK